MKTIQLTCKWCNKKFTRKLTEHNKNLKENRTNTFCSRQCSGNYSNSLRDELFYKQAYEKQKKTFDIKNLAGNRKDELSPFRFFLNKGKKSIIKHNTEIDEKYLKELWEKQKGICPYTGIKMILPQTTHQKHKIKNLKRASLDRIDSKKGYIKDNIEFVCLAINYAKCNFTKEEMINFIKEIKTTIIE